MASQISVGFFKRFATAPYAIALLSVAAATGVRLALEPVLHDHAQYLTFFAAIVAARRLAGRGPALAATVLSLLAVWYLFLEPRYSFALADPYAVVGLGLFALTGAAISFLETSGGGRSSRPAPGPGQEYAVLAGAPWLRRIAMMTLAALAMGVLATLLWAGFQQSIEAEAWVEHTYQVLNAAGSARSSLEGAEAAQRGYLLTAEDRFFQNYQSAVASEREAQSALRRLTVDNPIEQARLEEIDRLTRTRLDLLAEGIALSRDQGPQAAADLVRTGGGKETMERLRTLLSALDDEERRLLNARTKAAAASDLRTRWILGLGSGCLVILLILAGASIERHIYERDRVERALARLARLIDLSHDAIITADGERRITGWNAGAQEMYGWAAEQAIGRTIHTLLETASSIPIGEVDRILAREERWDGELAHTCSDGRRIVVESRHVLLRDEAGEPAGYLEINREITARKQAEEALRESESRLHRLGDNLPEAAIYKYRLDAGGQPHVDFISAGIERLTGVPAAEFMQDASAVERSVVPEDRALLRAGIAASRDGLTRFEGEIRHRHRDTGEIRWSILRSVPTRHPDGSTTWDGIELDITERKRTEEALRENEAVLRSFFDSPGVMRGIVELASGSIVHVSSNAAAAEMFGVDEVVEAWSSLYDDCRRTGKPVSGEYAQRDAEGKERWVSATVSYLGNSPAGHPRFAYTALDLTERWRAEEALRLSEEKFARAFATNPAAVTITRLEDGKFIDVNETWQATIGYSREEALGRCSTELHIWPAAAERERYTAELMARGSIHGWEQTLLRKSGEPFAALLSAVVLTIAGEQVILSATLDISERKRAEEAVRQSEERFRALTTASSDVVYRMSPEWSEMLHLDGRGFLADTEKPHRGWLAEYIPPSERLRVLAAIGEAIRTRGIFELEYAVLRLDGSLGWTFSRAVPLIDARGEIVEWFGAASDISQRKEAEAALRESEAQFRTLANGIPQLCWMANPDGAIFWYNERWYEYTGTTPEQMAGWGWQSVHDPVEMPKVLERWQSSIATGDPFDMVFPLRGGDGVFRPFLTRIMPVRGGDGRVVRWFGTNTDISEQRRIEDALRESRTRLEAALTSMTDAVFISDADGRFVHVNDAFATFHRFGSREECLQSLAEYPAILDVFLPDGSPAPLEQWAVPRALRGESVSNAEYTLRRKDTGESWVGSYSFGPIRGQDGRIAGSVVVARDITERKRAEEEIRQWNAALEQRVHERTAELEASNKELEAFAYSVSHDLRAPLRGIDGWSLALVEDYAGSLEPRALEYLGRVRSEAQRMGRLIDDLLQLSRITRAEMYRDAVDLSRIAESIAARLREAQPRRSLEFAIQPGLTAFGDARLLEVALTNLLQNSVKFTGPRGNACIRFEAVSWNGDPGFVVRDNGVGFDMAYAGRLFGAFHRLHSESEFPGTGVGLATVQRVIHRHGGRIWAEADPGRGADFYFTLGAKREQPKSHPAG